VEGTRRGSSGGRAHFPADTPHDLHQLDDHSAFKVKNQVEVVMTLCLVAWTPRPYIEL
jgi:hypothetical protein